MELERFHVRSQSDRDALNYMCCNICKRVSIEPQSCPSGHTFCASCINQYLEIHSVCPVDEAPLSKSDVKPSESHKILLNMLTIDCINRAPSSISSSSSSSSNSTTATTTAFTNKRGRGYGAVRPLQKRIHHCQWRGNVNDLKKHEENCTFRKEKCPKCHQPIPIIYMSAHPTMMCPRRLVQCQLCHENVESILLEQHTNHCPEAYIICPNHCTTTSPTGAPSLQLQFIDAISHGNEQHKRKDVRTKGKNKFKFRKKSTNDSDDNNNNEKPRNVATDDEQREKRRRRDFGEEDEEEEREKNKKKKIESNDCDDAENDDDVNDDVDNDYKYSGSPKAYILTLKRKDLKQHLTVCPNRHCRCEFAKFGCTFYGTVVGLEQHSRDAYIEHLSLLARAQADVMNALNIKPSALTAENTAKTTSSTEERLD